MDVNIATFIHGVERLMIEERQFTFNKEELEIWIQELREGRLHCPCQTFEFQIEKDTCPFYDVNEYPECYHCPRSRIFEYDIKEPIYLFMNKLNKLIAPKYLALQLETLL